MRSYLNVILDKNETMSKSYHATRKDLKGKTRKEVNEMVDDPDSVLHELAEKSSVKKKVKKERKNAKEGKGNSL